MKQFTKEEVYAYEEEISKLEEQIIKLRLDKIELKKQLDLHVVSRQLKGLFLKKDKATFCGYDVIVSEINKKWAIITDCNNHHYNARIKDLRPRTF